MVVHPPLTSGFSGLIPGLSMCIEFVRSIPWFESFFSMTFLYNTAKYTSKIAENLSQSLTIIK